MNANAPSRRNGSGLNWRVSSMFVGGAQVHNFGAVACMGRACTVSGPAFELPDSGLPGAPWRWTARGIGGEERKWMSTRWRLRAVRLSRLPFARASRGARCFFASRELFRLASQRLSFHQSFHQLKTFV
jgi:hypothetical protein